MGIMDRYVLRQFFQTYFMCFVSLAGLYIVFDAFTNLDEFLRCGSRAGGTLRLMASHYAVKSLLFFDLTSGLLTLVAALFTLTWFQRHNEMTALMSAGISRVRVVVPVIIASVVLTGLAAANRELVMPLFWKELARKPRNLIGDVGQAMPSTYDNETKILFRGEETFADRHRIVRPKFLLPRGLDRYGEQLIAQEAFYLPAEADRPSGYLLDVVEKPKDLVRQASLVQGDRSIIITPVDAPLFLGPDQCFVVSRLGFEQLTGGDAWQRFASTRDLIAESDNRAVEFGPEVLVTIHTRIIHPLMDMTMLFLGLPLVLRRESRNVFLAIGLCCAIVLVFLLVEMVFGYLGGVRIISPALAAWAPLMLFIPVAVAMAEGMRR